MLDAMEATNEIGSTDSVNTEIKKARKRSEYRTIYGANTIRETSRKVMAVMADFQRFYEICDRHISAGFFKSRDECINGNDDGLKISVPSGVTELYNLRKQIRMALMRPEIVVDAIKLAKVAEFVATLVTDENIIVRREKIEQEAKNDEQPN
jgi:hypothetical protein